MPREPRIHRPTPPPTASAARSTLALCACELVPILPISFPLLLFVRIGMSNSGRGRERTMVGRKDGGVARQHGVGSEYVLFNYYLISYLSELFRTPCCLPISFPELLTSECLTSHDKPTELASQPWTRKSSRRIPLRSHMPLNMPPLSNSLIGSSISAIRPSSITQIRS